MPRADGVDQREQQKEDGDGGEQPAIARDQYAGARPLMRAVDRNERSPRCSRGDTFGVAAQGGMHNSILSQRAGSNLLDDFPGVKHKHAVAQVHELRSFR